MTGSLHLNIGSSYGALLLSRIYPKRAEGLAGLLYPGGLVGLEASAHDVYQLTYQRVE